MTGRRFQLKESVNILASSLLILKVFEEINYINFQKENVDPSLHDMSSFDLYQPVKYWTNHFD